MTFIPVAAPLTAPCGKGGFTDPVNDNILAFGIGGSETGFALRSNPSHSGDKGDGGINTTLVGSRASVRRLTPVECERLQGFPDGWTAGESDSARYRALGNAVTVPVIHWIGRRIMKAAS
jgi:DNA (cytosine-5)-methyltransferase 1